MRSSPPVLLLLILAVPAFATDGVLEINQTCATQSGCFPGDAPGYPVEIAQPGSYRLTGNLYRLVPQTLDIDFIEVLSDDVTLDLGGFRISCSSLVVGGACAGLAQGIDGLGASNTTVRNGTVRGMPNAGVSLGSQPQVEAMTARENGGFGIRTGAASIVSGNTAFDNGGDGISVSIGSLVSGNSVYNNGGDGIDAGPGSLVQSNAVRNNDGRGLVLTGLGGNHGAYRENTISFNDGGTVQGGTNLGANFCDTNATCP
jgi:hypothetical protein